MPPAHHLGLAAALLKKQAITMLCHPAGPCQMAIMNSSGAFSLRVGVDPENDSNNLAPVSPFRCGVEHAHIGFHVRPVVVRQYGAIRRLIQKSRQ